MKKKTITYEPSAEKPMVLNDQVVDYMASSPPAMVRTQIYLSRAEYDFVQAEASRRDQPMASVIREFIDQQMGVSETGWDKNPLLQAPVDDPDYVHRPDGVVNHDHYIYGGPKKHKQVKGKWAPLPVDE